MLIPSFVNEHPTGITSLSRRVNANSQRSFCVVYGGFKLIKKGEC